MKCVICHSDNIAKKRVDEEIRRGSDMILVQVDTPVCFDCGERYYDRRTMLFLEDVAEKIKSDRIGLEPIGRVLRAVGT